MAHRSSTSERFSVDELILNVPSSYDPARIDLLAYRPFIERLCGGRGYQVNAIETTLRFFCGGLFANTAELAADAFSRSASLKRLYAEPEALVDRLPLKDMLAASVDLATGTGKSFVMYAVARIMLNEGLVDRVLVLCPTRTIEAGLIGKFVQLGQDPDLTNLLPIRAGFTAPSVVTADSLVQSGEICVENVHAIYAATGSSIQDSFKGNGPTTLLISDEAHHIYSPTGVDLKRWLEFILDEHYQFRYHLGLSGTCYVGDTYFSDVIFRYGIREAIDDGWVKQIYYLAEDASSSQDEIFQKLATQHEKNRDANPGIKPLTIAITNNIVGAEALALELSGFLARHLRLTLEEAQNRVLVVTSSPRHASNLAVLPLVDQATNAVEWIVSVAMLSEGWDVQNVFQIYPHEKRAFNSRLLISQVLGRGLRRPPTAGIPTVYVFNHQKWSREVGDLVASVLDQEAAVSQHPVEGRQAPHIALHQLVYGTTPTGIEARPVEGPRAIRRLSLRPQRSSDAETRFVSATDANRTSVLTTRVLQRMSPVEDVVEDVRQRMLEHDRRTSGTLAQEYSRDRISHLISDALSGLGIAPSVGLSQENRQMVLSAFGSLRQKTQRPGAIYVSEPTGLKEITTEHMPVVRVKVSALASTAGLFFDELSEGFSTPEDVAALRRVISSDVVLSATEVPNSFDFKSPTNVVLTSYGPEKRFVGRLVHPRNASCLRSWVKSPDVGFFSIEYSYRQGVGRSLRGQFNPDFLLWLAASDDVHVVETKADADVSAVNAGKLVAARAYFETVNSLMKRGQKRRYYFHMLTPVDYEKFFQSVRDGDAKNFRSGLEAALTAL